MEKKKLLIAILISMFLMAGCGTSEIPMGNRGALEGSVVAKEILHPKHKKEGNITVIEADKPQFTQEETADEYGEYSHLLDEIGRQTEWIEGE